MGLFDDLMPATPGPPGVPRITVTPNDRPAIPAEGRQLLDAIAGSESPGYDVKYGGGKFTDFTDHPREAVPIRTGPNAGRTSSAAGRYQFLGSTWDEVKKEAGLTDFSPDSQDQGAWHLANKTYQQKTGRDLAQDLQSAKGNPQAIAGIGRTLSGVWTSLPGGIEPNKATSSFASRYDGGTAPTELSSQSRRTMGLFDDLVPQGQVAAPPVSGTPPSAAGGEPAPRVAREGMSEPAPPPTGALEAGARGAATGVTANFYDELRGLMEAGGLNPKDPASLKALVSGAYKYWTGDQKAAETYDMTVARERGLTQKAEADQPVASIVGNVVGGVALPLGAAARGATLAERATQGARVGAAVGGLSGVGGGEDTAGRVAGGALGAGAGAAIGAVAPAAIEGVVRGARSAAVPIANAVRGIRDPEGEAARRVTLALERDIKADPSASTRLTPVEFAASVQSGGPAKIMDIGGETTRALARSASNTSPEGRQLLNNTINDRFEGQYGRVTDFVNKQFNYPNAYATEQALEAAKKTINTPAYAKAYAAPGARSMWDDGFEQMVQAPEVQAAIRKVIPQSASQAAMQGATPIRNPFVTDAASGRMVLRQLPDGSTATPNLQFWDRVKRELDKGDWSSREWSRIMRSHADTFVPEYKKARAGASILFDAENAHEAGKNFVRQTKDLNAARADYAKLNPKEKELFQDGFLSDFMESLGNVADRRDVLNKINATPNAKAKLSMVLGPKWPEMEAGLRAEGVMDLARKAVQGNSTTARQLAELGLAGGTYGLGTGGDVLNPNPTAIMNAALVYGAARGRTKINEGLSRKVAEMLTSNDPALLLKGIKIVGKNEALLTSLRRADAALARSGAEQSASLPAVQSSVLSRAQEDENAVPRPPGQ